MALSTPIQYLKGVGPKLALSLNRLGITSLEDCLWVIPREYDDRRQLLSLSQIRIGEHNAIEGRIETLSEKKTKTNARLIQASIRDTTGQITAIWFNQPYLLKILKPGQLVFLKGKVDRTSFDPYPTMMVSDMELIDPEKRTDHVGAIFPIYALTEGVYQSKMRQIMREALQRTEQIQDFLPVHIRSEFKLMSKEKALKTLHYPPHWEALDAAKESLSFEELIIYQLRLGQKRHVIKKQSKTEALTINGPLVQAYKNRIPYTLTGAQTKAVQEIQADLSTTEPMNRLLQGDVGSGKTDVAIMTLLAALDSGKTGALMAPTEILAAQLYYKLSKIVGPLGIEINLLKGKMKLSERRRVLSVLETQPVQLIVGTHALIEEAVQIPHLGVAVIDEQHRFGVVQRLKLVQKGITPHCLYMTATPIPRTFTLTCFGDLDHTTMTELPKGRVPPTTLFVKPPSLEKVLQACEEQLKKGHQLYVVYPLVEESEKLDLKSAVEGWEQLKQRYPRYQVGLIHGKMTPEEKAIAMDAFKENQTQILVATTVIEVGIDVPNATMIIINHAERFGLSQLHQLRGRVGRGGNASWCYLVGNPKTESGKKRINAMKSTTDGFKLAEYDMLIRGPGDMLGTKQAGLPDFKVADLIRDEALLKMARKKALDILKEDPFLTRMENKGLHQAVTATQSEIEKVNLN